MPANNLGLKEHAVKRAEFLDLLKENNQAKINKFIADANEKNDDLNHYEDVTDFTHTPLLDAVTEGNETAASSLLATTKVLVDGNGWGYSPLMIASAKGFVGIMQILFAYHPNLNYDVEWSQTSPREIQIIRTNKTHIETARFNMLKEYRYCAVDNAETLAVRHSNFVCLKLISEWKGNQINVEDNSLLCLAAEENQVAIAKHLVSIGYNVNELNAKKEPPILLAARYGCFEMAQYLLSLNPEQKDIHTALKEAIDRKDVGDGLETIEILMAADKNLHEPFSSSHDMDESAKKSLMDYAVQRFEVPDSLGFSAFEAFDPSVMLPKISVICLLLEAGVKRLSEPCAIFSDGSAFKSLSAAHQALLGKGLHAKEIAAQIIANFNDPNVKTESSSVQPAAVANQEVKPLSPQERMNALMKAAKPATIQEEQFQQVVGPLVAFFEVKAACSKWRQEKSAKPVMPTQTLFLRTLTQQGYLCSRPETGLISESAQVESAASSSAPAPRM